jgi:hypothetical protein
MAIQIRLNQASTPFVTVILSQAIVNIRKGVKAVNKIIFSMRGIQQAAEEQTVFYKYKLALKYIKIQGPIS